VEGPGAGAPSLYKGLLTAYPGPADGDPLSILDGNVEEAALSCWVTEFQLPCLQSVGISQLKHDERLNGSGDHEENVD